MHSILISLLLIPSFYQAVQSDEAPGPLEIEIIIDELDLALDNFFSLLDEQDLDVYVAGVRHAARARLLLEQHLGEEIDDLSWEASKENREEFQLHLIARRASDLSGEAGRKIWEKDYDDKQWALLRLSELEHMVKNLTKSISDR